MRLNDSALLRQQAYIDGEWIVADDGSRFELSARPMAACWRVCRRWG